MLCCLNGGASEELIDVAVAYNTKIVQAAIIAFELFGLPRRKCEDGSVGIISTANGDADFLTKKMYQVHLDRLFLIVILAIHKFN
jgi:hypothetical protein